MGQPIPEFTDEGLLPPGDYEVTFEELRESVLVEGPGPESVWGEEWDREWREHLTRQAETMCNQLWEVGIEDIYLDGSFTEAKAHPNDIDGYFECDARRVATGELQRKLNQIDPKKCWTWDPKQRRAYRGYAKKQLPILCLPRRALPALRPVYRDHRRVWKSTDIPGRLPKAASGR